MIPLLTPGHGDGVGRRETRIGNHTWRVTGYWTHGTTRFANLTREDRAETRTVTVARLRGEGS